MFRDLSLGQNLSCSLAFLSSISVSDSGEKLLGFSKRNKGVKDRVLTGMRYSLSIENGIGIVEFKLGSSSSKITDTWRSQMVQKIKFKYNNQDKYTSLNGKPYSDSLLYSLIFFNN